MSHIERLIVEQGIPKPVVRLDFLLRIVPPRPPQKISISKVRDFILYMRDVMGVNIKKVTYDQAFSAESLQILDEQGVPKW